MTKATCDPHVDITNMISDERIGDPVALPRSVYFLF